MCDWYRFQVSRVILPYSKWYGDWQWVCHSVIWISLRCLSIQAQEKMIANVYRKSMFMFMWSIRCALRMMMHYNYISCSWYTREMNERWKHWNQCSLSNIVYRIAYANNNEEVIGLPEFCCIRMSRSCRNVIKSRHVLHDWKKDEKSFNHPPQFELCSFLAAEWSVHSLHGDG